MHASMLTSFFSASLTMPIVPIATPIALLSIHLSIMLVMTTGVSRAAEYIEPDHTTELFQLEKIPLPQHRMQQHRTQNARWLTYPPASNGKTTPACHAA